MDRRAGARERDREPDRGRRPLLGLTCGSIGSGRPARFGQNRAYLDAIRRVGADVVLVPSGSPAELVDRFDGLVLSGGPDVEPARYRGRPEPGLGDVDGERDQTELALLARAMERRLPVLAICRGLQVVNVGCGGTLVQDLASAGESDLEHRASVRDERVHEVAVEPGSRLAGLLGAERAAVNSLHHQAVADLGRGLRVTARAPDGVVEGLESEDGIVVAVQWHPEELRSDPAGDGLLAGWVAGLR